MKNCSNCQVELHGKYCHQCGQYNDIERLTFKSLLELAQTHLFDIDSRIFRTFRDMFTRPGKVCKDYIMGKRKSYVNPVNYFLISGTLIILVTSWLPRDVNQMLSAFNPNVSHLEPEKAQIVLQSQRDLVQFIIENFRLINISIYLSLPFFLALFFRYKHYAYSLTDYFVFILFTASQINFISAPLHVLSHTMDLPLLIAFSVILMPIYIIYSGAGFFRKLTLWMVIKLGFASIFSFLIYALFIVLVFSLVLFYRLGVI